MGRRYIYYRGELYAVVGIGQSRRGGNQLCFTAIELGYINQLPNDNIPCVEVPVQDAIEITNEKTVELLRILYEQ